MPLGFGPQGVEGSRVNREDQSTIKNTSDYSEAYEMLRKMLVRVETDESTDPKPMRGKSTGSFTRSY